MYYDLKITNKDDFIKHVSNIEEIGILEKDDFTVIQYNVESPYLFDNEYAVESRGIIFDNETGKCIRRPLPKFKNVNQSEETQQAVLDSEAHPILVTEKLDGTMICPFRRSNGTAFWGTKRASDDFHEHIVSCGILTQNYIDFVNECFVRNISPVFEFHDPSYVGSVIVIHYEERFLKLLAMRNIDDGSFIDIEQCSFLHNVPTVKRYPTFESIADAISKTVDMCGAEGFVISMSNGKMVKLKTHWYVYRHKLIDVFSTKRLMCDIYLTFLANHVYTNDVKTIIYNSFDDGDDILSHLSQQQLSNFSEAKNFIDALIDKISHEIIRVKFKYENEKDYALNCSNKIFSNIMFNSFKKDVNVVEFLKRYTSSNKQFNKLS